MRFLRFIKSRRSVVVGLTVIAVSLGGPAIADCVKVTKANPAVTLNASVTPEGCVNKLDVSGDSGIKQITVNGNVKTLPWSTTKPGSYDVQFTYVANVVVKNNPNGVWEVPDNCGPAITQPPCYDTIGNVWTNCKGLAGKAKVRAKNKCTSTGYNKFRLQFWRDGKKQRKDIVWNLAPCQEKTPVFKGKPRTRVVLKDVRTGQTWDARIKKSCAPNDVPGGMRETPGATTDADTAGKASAA